MYKFLRLLLTLSIYLPNTSAQCDPQILSCNAAISGCDLTANDNNYWNDPAWWDDLNQSHDLAETQIDLGFVLHNNCPNDTLSVRCLLFLDLDVDGVEETVIDSDNFPATGVVNFGNAANPNYAGGTPILFDRRPLPANQKWRFALNSTIAGDTSTFQLNWVNEVNPSIFQVPELAYGAHSIRWVVSNSQGVFKTCEKSFVVKDCKAPTVVCINGINVNILPTHQISLWASDFLHFTEDNVTQPNLIQLGLRKTGTGTGFPLDAFGNPINTISFNCEDLGVQGVELWAMDAAGNVDFCETYIIVQDNLSACLGPQSPIEVCAKAACFPNDFLEETLFNYEIRVPGTPPADYFETGACISIVPPNAINTEIKITPSNDYNPLNGVSTFDLLQIANFIAGIDAFDSPYAWIAADANNDKVIDTLDIIACKKLILGVFTELPFTFRFVDKNYVFPSPNPLSAPFPESITLNTSNTPPPQVEFVGVKICDISCANLVGFYETAATDKHLIGAPSPNPTQEGALLPIQLPTCGNGVFGRAGFFRKNVIPTPDKPAGGTSAA